MADTDLKQTPLHQNHVALGARMVPFAGYDMPVQYPLGVMGEHLWTRSHAGLFDVSHMGQAFLTGLDFADLAKALERLVPADIAGLAPSQQRYTQFLNSDGAILDDLMVTRLPEGRGLYLVVNAGRKEADYAHLRRHLPADVNLSIRDDLALIALQGPMAETVLTRLVPAVASLGFMHSGQYPHQRGELHISRSGYTGEDGFEISASATAIQALWEDLLRDSEVKPIGLGARDSLRLEAGLCLYGHDIDETTSPIEAGLQWSIQKSRRTAHGFEGAGRVLQELAQGPARKRVGIKPEGRAIAREGALVLDKEGRKIGQVTSGGFGPTMDHPVAMAYVEAAYAAVGMPVQLVVRDRALPASVINLPFVPNRFKR